MSLSILDHDLDAIDACTAITPRAPSIAPAPKGGSEERLAIIAAIVRLSEILANLADVKATPPKPVIGPEEQEVLDVVAASPRPLTGAQIADLTMRTIDNGTFRNLLAKMVRKGLLVNHKPGYALA